VKVVQKEIASNLKLYSNLALLREILFVVFPNRNCKLLVTLCLNHTCFPCTIAFPTFLEKNPSEKTIEWSIQHRISYFFGTDEVDGGGLFLLINYLSGR
jgi:hypothetical protein